MNKVNIRFQILDSQYNRKDTKLNEEYGTHEALAIRRRLFYCVARRVTSFISLGLSAHRRPPLPDLVPASGHQS